MNYIQHYPRGFLLTARPSSAPAGFVKGPFLENFWVEKLLKVDASNYGDSLVIVVGECYSQLSSETGEPSPSSQMLAGLRISEESFFEKLRNFAGRFAVFFGSRQKLRIVTDATGTRSVFYSMDGSVVASHALLAASYLPGEIVKSNLVYRTGFPGNGTPYGGVKILTANMRLEFGKSSLQRYWPLAPISPTSVAEASRKTVEATANALKNIARERPVRLALTAGFDSRLVFAVALHSGIEFETFTYGEASRDTEIDCAVARDLSAKYGIRHSLPEKVENSPELQEALDAASYNAHHKKWVGGLIEHFDGTNPAIISANLLEIGRNHYPDLEALNFGHPGNPEVATKMYLKRLSRRLRKEVVSTQSYETYAETVLSYFTQWIDDIGGFTPEYLFGLTQLYWEHRMSAWYGSAMTERDFYGESVIPFNSHGLFETLLGVDKELRDKNYILSSAIYSIDPGILEIPVNPPKWPLED